MGGGGGGRGGRGWNRMCHVECASFSSAVAIFFSKVDSFKSTELYEM